jgi:hypothetical protein
MEIEAWAANRLADSMADMLTGGYVEVFDLAGQRLAVCPFSGDGFGSSENGSVSANPFPPAVAESDGIQARFEAFAPDGRRVLAGTAGYRDDEPEPEMKFKTRMIVKDADVMIESFVVSIVARDNGA